MSICTNTACNVTMKDRLVHHCACVKAVLASESVAQGGPVWPMLSAIAPGSSINAELSTAR